MLPSESAPGPPTLLTALMLSSRGAHWLGHRAAGCDGGRGEQHLWVHLPVARGHLGSCRAWPGTLHPRGAQGIPRLC